MLHAKKPMVQRLVYLVGIPAIHDIEVVCYVAVRQVGAVVKFGAQPQKEGAFTVLPFIKRVGFNAFCSNRPCRIAGFLRDDLPDVHWHREVVLRAQPVFQGINHRISVWAAHGIEIHNRIVAGEFWAVEDGGAVQQPASTFLGFLTVKRRGFKRDGCLVFLITGFLLDDLPDFHWCGEVALRAQPVFQGVDYRIRVCAAHGLEVYGNIVVVEFWAIEDGCAVQQPIGTFLGFFTVKGRGFKHDALLEKTLCGRN